MNRVVAWRLVGSQLCELGFARDLLEALVVEDEKT